VLYSVAFGMRKDQTAPGHRPMRNTAGIVYSSIDSMAPSPSIIIPPAGLRSLYIHLYSPKW